MDLSPISLFMNNGERYAEIGEYRARVSNAMINPGHTGTGLVNVCSAYIELFNV